MVHLRAAQPDLTDANTTTFAHDRLDRLWTAAWRDGSTEAAAYAP
jgi:hypothetical protein